MTLPSWDENNDDVGVDRSRGDISSRNVLGNVEGIAYREIGPKEHPIGHFSFEEVDVAAGNSDKSVHLIGIN